MSQEYEFIERGTEKFPVGLFAQTIYLDKPHHHIEYELFYLKNGRAIFGIEDQEFKLYPGDFLFINPGVTHYAKSAGEGEVYNYIAMVFDISLLGKPGDPCRQFFENIRIKRFVTMPKEISEKLVQATDLVEKKSEGHEIVVKSVLYDIISFVITSGQYEVVSLIETKKLTVFLQLIQP